MPTKTRFNGKNYTQLPQLVSDGVILKGLPNTPSAPAGYGDLATVINDLADNGVIDDPVMSLEPVDFYDMRVMADFLGFGYGVNATADSQIIRLNLQTGEKTNFGNPVPVGNFQNIAFLPDGTVFAEGHSGDNLYKLYRSTDSGVSWDLVNTQTITQVYSARNRGILRFKNLVVYCEYNVNGSRVAGGANDRVRVRTSSDNGSTWQDSIVWNTNGTTTNVRHIHGAVQSMDGEYIYLMTGDNNSESAIIRWDGATVIPQNTPVTQITATTGLSALAGRQAFRTNDIVEESGILYWISDAVNNEPYQFGNLGAFKCGNDLSISSFEKISDISSDVFGCAGRLGVLLDGGEIVWQVNQEDATTGNRYTPIVVSNKTKTQWKVVGAYKGREDTQFYYRRSFFKVGNTMYMSNEGGSGKSETTTIAFRLSDKKYTGDFETVNIPVTLHPVFWVDPVNGSDSNNGWSPRAPFATIAHAITGSRMPYGASLNVPDGDWDIPATTPVMSAATRNGDPADYLEIKGSAATKCTLLLESASSNTNMFFVGGAAACRLQLRDISLATRKSNTVAVSSNVANGDSTHAVRLVNAMTLGNKDKSFGNQFVINKISASAYGSIMEQTDGINSAIFYTRTGGTGGQMNVYLEKSVMINSRRFIDTVLASNKVYAFKCKFINPALDVIRRQSGAVVDIRFIDCEFYTTNNKTSVTLLNEGAADIPVSFFSAKGNLPFGYGAAFDVRSANTPIYGLLVNRDDYVY